MTINEIAKNATNDIEKQNLVIALMILRCDADLAYANSYCNDAFEMADELIKKITGLAPMEYTTEHDKNGDLVDKLET